MLHVGTPPAFATQPGWAAAAPVEPGAHVEVRIAKQTVYGITLEWFAAAAVAAAAAAVVVIRKREEEK